MFTALAPRPIYPPTKSENTGRFLVGEKLNIGWSIWRCSELLSIISKTADSGVTFVTAVCVCVCLQYIIIVAASILISRKRRRRRQYRVKLWIRMRNVRGAYHSLFQQLLTTDAQSFQNFMKMDVVAFEDVLSCVEARRGWPQHQRSDWLEPQKPRPIYRREWTLLIHVG